MAEEWVWIGEEQVEDGGMWVNGTRAVRITPTRWSGRQKNAWFVGIGRLDDERIFWLSEVFVVQIGKDQYDTDMVQPNIRLGSRVKLESYVKKRWLV